MRLSILARLPTLTVLVSCVLSISVSADTSTIWSEIKSNSQTSIFAKHVESLGLSEALDTSNLIIPWTLFVPNNDAFTNLPQALKEKMENDEQFRRKIITSHMVLGASVSVDGIGAGNTLTSASGLEMDLIQKDELYIKDVVVTKKDIVSSNGVIHVVECVMYVQPSADDDRLKNDQKEKFAKTACCLAESLNDKHHMALVNN